MFWILEQRTYQVLYHLGEYLDKEEEALKQAPVEQLAQHQMLSVNIDEERSEFYFS